MFILFVVFINSICLSQNNEKYIVNLPSNYDEGRSYPLFLALHGGYGSKKKFSKKWKSYRLKSEFITAYLEASHLDTKPNKWGWRDEAIERKNIVNYYNEIVANYNIDNSNVYIGGFSLGAKMSVDAVMNGAIPIKGVISICHGGRLSSMVNSSYLEQSVKEGVKYVIIYGENDTSYKYESTVLIELIDKLGGKYLYQEIEMSGHDIPYNFKVKMDEEWLPFLMNN